MPLSAEQLHRQVPGYPDSLGRVPPVLRTGQGRPAGDGCPVTGDARARDRPSARRLRHRRRRVLPHRPAPRARRVGGAAPGGVDRAHRRGPRSGGAVEAGGCPGRGRCRGDGLAAGRPEPRPGVRSCDLEAGHRVRLPRGAAPRRPPAARLPSGPVVLQRSRSRPRGRPKLPPRPGRGPGCPRGRGRRLHPTGDQPSGGGRATVAARERGRDHRSPAGRRRPGRLGPHHPGRGRGRRGARGRRRHLRARGHQSGRLPILRAHLSRPCRRRRAPLRCATTW